MDEGTAHLASAIGARVRAERQRRRLTLDQLAESAGVSRRMVVNVEQGSVNPSVGTLLRLSAALGVGLPALVTPPQAKPLEVTPSGEGAVLWRGEFGGTGTLVARTNSPDVLELWDWTLGAGDRHVSESHATGTQELVQVRSGTLTIGVDGEVVRLTKGDALVFPGDVSHSYENLTAKPTTFSLVVSEPRDDRGRPVDRSR